MTDQRVLIIDENPRRRRSAAAFLTGLDMPAETAASLAEILDRPGAFETAAAVVLSFPVWRNGLADELALLRRSFPRLSVIVLAAPRDPRRLLDLVRRGVVDRVASPDNPLALYGALRGEAARLELVEENTAYRRTLAKLKLERVRHVRRALDLEEIYDATIENLMTALDLRDVETYGHSRTVAKYSQVLAGLLGLENSQTLDHIRKGALLHDVGKIAIPDAILKKPGPLTREEWVKVRLHPALGYGLIKEIKFIREAGNIILCHHERYDGTGYPKGLRGETIPLEARIFAVADALDAITSHRPYRSARDFGAAAAEIRAHSGSQFDPRIVKAFSSLEPDRWAKIRFETTRLLPAIEEFRRLAAPGGPVSPPRAR